MTNAVSISDDLIRIDLSLQKSLKRTRAFFSSSRPIDVSDATRHLRLRTAIKISDEYRDSKTLPSAVLEEQATPKGPAKPQSTIQSNGNGFTSTLQIEGTERGLIKRDHVSSSTTANPTSGHVAHLHPTLLSKSLIRRREAASVKPDFHPQWKLYRVISGHLGWVRSVAVEPGNQWFVTGAGDRIIKVWDMASCNLKLSLTGHISTVRGLAVSDRHPYLFSCGEDKMVKCWDLEQNKVIRHYHGHLSGVYSLSLHPTLDVLVTAGRDASARVWDMRTKAQVFVLSGHTSTIADVKCQESDPQVITGSMDSTIRLWDLAAGRTMAQLTHHHKSVRSLTIHPTEYSFASGSSGGNNIKKWKCPEGTFVHNFSGHDAIINTVRVNEDGVMFSGADNGSMTWWDYKTGLPFQTMSDTPQPGSLDAEAGIFTSTFDVTGTRLITGCADKTIKIYREVS